VWLRAEVHDLQTAELERSVIQLAQLAAEGQAARNHGAGQLLSSFAAASAVRSGNTALCDDFFQRLMVQDHQAYANFGLLAPNGNVVCAGVPPKDSANAADRPYFRDAVQRRALTVSTVTTGRITGREIVTYALPVMDGVRMLGVVFASMDVDSMSASLARVHLPEGGVIAILDRTGMVAARYPAAETSARPPRVTFPTETRDGVFVRVTRGPDGRRRLYAAVPVDAERTMYAAAGLLIEPVTDAADSRVIAALLILLGCTVVVFTIALIGAERGIRRPIMRVLSAVTRFGHGELETRAGQVGGACEFQELGRGFDRMADQLTTRHAQMRQSQRLEAVGQLAGGVAHDFNNILTAIIGFGEELREEVSSIAGQEYLNEVLSAADRAKELTRQLLAFSRRQMMQPATLQLNTVISGFTALLQRVIGDDITLVTQLGSELGHVRADRAQIEQVLMNLVVNGRDAMPGGGVLTIATDNITFGADDALPEAVGEASEVPPGDYVRLLVTDSGTGITADTQARMFEPFFSTKGPMGTGLGLAMVYGIVRQSEGHISCWSEMNVGTTFGILLPRTFAPVDAVAATITATKAASGVETILVVEDEPSVRALAACVLRHRGYTVVEAGSGEAAIEQLDNGVTPHLLLCDLVMPGMNGHQVAAAARDRHSDIRVVYMSGYDDHHALSSSAMSGAAFLQKPFTPDALAQQVRASLDSATELTRSSRD